MNYGFSFLVASVCTVISFVLSTHIAPINLVMVYLLGTLLVASRGQRGPAAFSSALGVLAFDFFFVPPRFSFTVQDAEYIFTFIVMFTVAIIISHLTIRLRSEAKAARQGEKRTSLMHEFSQSLAQARRQADVLYLAALHLQKMFNSEITLFVGDDDGHVVPVEKARGRVSEKEIGVAQWVFEKGQAAGLGEASLPAEPALFVPLRGSAGIAGVMRLEPRRNHTFSSSERQLLEAFAHQIALSLEVERLEEKAKDAALQAETEQLRSALLSSVSHDFKTPLTAIVGSASILMNRDDVRANPKMKELVETIQDEGERLSRQIQNLLETTRLESGAVKIHKERYSLEEIIGSALERMPKAFKDRPLTIAIAETIALVPMDPLLLEQVFMNLFENAFRHTPGGTKLDVSARLEGSEVEVIVSDFGLGLKPDELEKIFEKFYHQKSSTGAGLGLAICRAIINAHGGRIWAENRKEGGASFHFTLPLEK